jgi:hypothetical protein
VAAAKPLDAEKPKKNPPGKPRRVTSFRSNERIERIPIV